jgi:hypothetical protein
MIETAACTGSRVGRSRCRGRAQPPEVFVSERAPGPHRSADHSTEPEEQALAGGLAEGDELDGRGDLLLALYPGVTERGLLEPGQSGAEAAEGPGRGKVGV